MANLRDIAETVGGIEAGVLLRSEAPTEGDLVAAPVGPWPPATVVDLRDPIEWPGEHPFADVSVIAHHPILDLASVRSDGAMPTGLAELYLGMLEPPAAGRLVAALRAVAAGAAPILVHCSGGKDRTGVLVALVARLVGAAREEIVADYVRTDAVVEAVLERLRTFLDELVGSGAADNVPEEMKRAPASAIEAVLDHLDAWDGGAEGWFTAHGGDPSTLTALRTRFQARSDADQ